MPYHVIKPTPRKPILSDGNSFDTAKTWDTVLPEGTSGMVTLNVNTSTYEAKLYAVMKLAAGTKYTLSTDNADGKEIKLYGPDQTQLGAVSQDHGETGPIVKPLEVTPAETGLHYVYINSYYGMSTTNISMSPRPEPYSKPAFEPWVTARGFDERGYLIPYLSTFDANRGAGSVNEEGMIFKFMMDKKDISRADTGQKLTVQNGVITGGHMIDGIPCCEFNTSFFKVEEWDNHIFPLNHPLAMSVWIRPGQFGSYNRGVAELGCTWGYGAYDDKMFAIMIVQELEVYGGFTDCHAYVPNLLTQWTHVVLIYTGDKYQLYINNKLESEQAGICDIYQEDGNFTIGEMKHEQIDPYKGYMAGFRLYDRALSPREVKNLNMELKPLVI